MEASETGAPRTRLHPAVDRGNAARRHWIDPIYLIAAICLGAAVWQPTEATSITSRGNDDRRLLDQVRTDPLTGLGNRGRMQVDLERACERASAEQSATLYLATSSSYSSPAAAASTASG